MACFAAYLPKMKILQWSILALASWAISGKWHFYAIRFWCQPQCHGRICGQQLILSRKLMSERPICDQSRRMLLLSPTECHRNSVISSRLPMRCLKLMPFWHPLFPNYQQHETPPPILLALMVLKARGFTAKLNGLANFWLTMLSAASLTESMPKRPINPALIHPLNAVATHL